MKLKICGLNNPENIEQIAGLNPDYMGFIFYPGSRRYVSGDRIREILLQIPNSINKVGVFVNESLDNVKRIYNHFHLDYVQLHGDEDATYCAKLYLNQIPIIKAFCLDESFGFRKLDAYVPFCHYFLFDTKGLLPGGNGLKFNWNMMESYDLKVPFFLSGGIDEGDAGIISKLSYEMLHAIDINSKFEMKPGTKDIRKVKRFFTEIKTLNPEYYEN